MSVNVTRTPLIPFGSPSPTESTQEVAPQPTTMPAMGEIPEFEDLLGWPTGFHLTPEDLDLLMLDEFPASSLSTPTTQSSPSDQLDPSYPGELTSEDYDALLHALAADVPRPQQPQPQMLLPSSFGISPELLAGLQEFSRQLGGTIFDFTTAQAQVAESPVMSPSPFDEFTDFDYGADKQSPSVEGNSEGASGLR